MSESVILCEGYHDRAFWAGWLKHLGCVDPGLPPAGSVRRRDIFDPWKTKVTRGQYAFLSKSGGFIRIAPCQGKTRLLSAARDRLDDRTRKALPRLIISIDSDKSVTGVATAAGLRGQDVERFVQNCADPSAALNAAGEIEVDGGMTKVCLVRWEVTDAASPALPDQQALERLVCSAIIAAYPPRAKAVSDWLASRPIPPAPDPKVHAWSYMAGWYAEHGCESFYSNLWNDPAIVAELQTRLQASGAWQIVTTLTT
jgi:hypothetical protein